jgi:alkylation response protein AidB-like acyl-CoA dehydrogenase
VAERILSSADLQFVLYAWLKVDNLTQRARYAEHSRETFDAAIELSQQLALDYFLPINALLDQNEPTFDGKTVTTPAPLKTALEHFCAAGLMAAGQDEAFGGMQLPHVIEKACFNWFTGACTAAAGYAMLTIGNANLLLRYGTAEQIRQFVKPMMLGRFFGTMCLSEPHAGSSLSDIRTRAEKQSDGSYRLYGNKMWISGGEHELSDNIVHLVLAKVCEAGQPVPAGVKSISLFLVPKKLVNNDGSIGARNDVVLAGLNHKMGFRGTTNCLLNFGEGQFQPGGQAGAIGYLVGAENQGLACMFHMMNEARIGVGIGAVMLGYAGFLHSLDYARNRPQGRKLGSSGAKDPQSPQQAIIEHADVKRMLLAQKSYVEGGLGLTLYCARLVDDWQTGETAQQREDALDLLELLTPIAKSWPSQWCLEANNLAIQVLGGYGYTRDYPVEQLYRDNRLNPIHEGTHGIQALDLLGRKVKQKNGRLMQLLWQRFSATYSACGDSSAALKSYANSHAAAAQECLSALKQVATAPNSELAVANASLFLEAFGHIVVAWIWLEQAIVAQQKITESPSSNSHDFYCGKLQAVQYFYRWELPKAIAQLELLGSLDDTTVAMQNNWF